MVSTHELIFHGMTVTKRFTSWNRSEHRREWAMLVHLDQHAPGLAPKPVTVDLDGRPGEPLRGTLSLAQLCGLVTGLKTLWAVPVEPLGSTRGWSDDLDAARRLTAPTCPTGDELGAAYRAAQHWWSGPDPELLRTRPRHLVVGHHDPNLANYLWDGARIRIVDFEDAAISDPATELAILVEHLSARGVETDVLLRSFDVDVARFRAARRLWAMFWLVMLLPGAPAEHRNPPRTAEHQARRLVELLDG